MKTNLLHTITLSLALSATLYAVPNIPANCTTPGTCAELTPALKSVTVKEGVKLADADASHTVTLKAAAKTTENVIITLPPVNGQPNQILATDASGNLVWKAEPQSDKFLGMICFMKPDVSKPIYELNGGTVTDAKLAAYLTANPIAGFSVSGSTVTLPDWRGRYLGANGGFGMTGNDGALYKDATAKNGLTMGAAGNHTHKIHYTNGGGGGGYLPTAQDAIGVQYNSHNNDLTYAGNHTHTLSSSDAETRPNSVAMPMVIIGGSN